MHTEERIGIDSNNPNAPPIPIKRPRKKKKRANRSHVVL